MKSRQIACSLAGVQYILPTKAFKILTKKQNLKREKYPPADSFFTEKHLLFPGAVCRISTSVAVISTCEFWKVPKERKRKRSKS